MKFYSIMNSRALTSLVLSACTWCAQAEEKYELKFEFKPDRQYLYQQDNQVEMDMKNPLTKAAMKMHTDMTIGYHYATKNVPKGVGVSMNFDAIDMTVQSNGVEMMTFNSEEEGKGNPMIEKMFQPLMEMSIEMTFDENGNVVEVGEVPETPQLKQMGFDQKTFEQMMTQGLTMMPKQPVAVGEGWQSNIELPMGGLSKKPAIIDVSYTLEGVDEVEGKQLARITFTGELNMEMDAENAPNLLIRTNRYDGTVWHDMDLKMTQKVLTNVDMLITVPNGKKVGENGLGEIPQKVTTTIELVEVKAL